MQRNRHDSIQCTADLQISGHSAENSKHLSAAVSGRAAAQKRGNRGKRGVTCAQVKKKRSLRTLPCRRTACSPQNLPLRKESSAKRKNCLREAEFPQQTTIPAENSNPAVHRSDFDADIGALCENCARSDESAAENPFPQLFPNSYWKKRQNDRRLFGKARVRGVMYGIIAVPSASRRPPAGLCGNLRRVRSNSGSWFWLGIRRE